MSETVIRIEGVSKQYRLGAVGTGSLAHDVNWLWYKIRGKEDPYLKVGEENDRAKKGGSDYVWALRDITFDVQHGEVLGIIGRNGAGKSTLLKILSRTTTPTLGQLKIKGRVASLLEVGTGFHPELTGRENVYLNGAILGMTKREITAKFDEIVNFAGIERYIDTPVKRYSSGMYVRLAFGVAAHLEPDILIVDEVLAVGDADFQNKALGKMKDVSSREGRTVLFVSHNMSAVRNLCTRAIFLGNGKVMGEGMPEEVINKYLLENASYDLEQYFNDPEKAPGNDHVRFKSMCVIPQLNSADEAMSVKTPIRIEFEFYNLKGPTPINLSLHLCTLSDEIVFNAISPVKILENGLHKGVLHIPGDFLNDGGYYVNVLIVYNSSKVIYNFDKAVTFTVEDKRDFLNWHKKWVGIVRPQFPFEILKMDE